MSLHKRASYCYRPLLFVLLAALVCAPSAFAQNQCVQKISELPAAPELLGFRLGMSKEEIKARVPQTVFGRTDDFGVSKTTINPYFDPRIDRTKFESVRSISLDLLDDHITSLWIGYDETYKVQSIDDFVKLISQSLHVSERWSPWKSRGQQLRCADFQLIVTTLAGGPSLRLLDLAAEDTVALRRQAKEERKSAAEPATSDGESEPAEIIGDKQTKTYYSGTCHPAKTIGEARRILFKTAEEAEKAGFKLAKDCR
jgi:hypothetical protein